MISYWCVPVISLDCGQEACCCPCAPNRSHHLPYVVRLWNTWGRGNVEADYGHAEVLESQNTAN